METELREYEDHMIKSQTELRDFSIKHGLMLSGLDPYVSSSVDRAATICFKQEQEIGPGNSGTQKQGLLPRKVGGTISTN